MQKCKTGSDREFSDLGSRKDALLAEIVFIRPGVSARSPYRRRRVGDRPVGTVDPSEGVVSRKIKGDVDFVCTGSGTLEYSRIRSVSAGHRLSAVQRDLIDLSSVARYPYLERVKRSAYIK